MRAGASRASGENSERLWGATGAAHAIFHLTLWRYRPDIVASTQALRALSASKQYAIAI